VEYSVSFIVSHDETSLVLSPSIDWNLSTLLDAFKLLTDYLDYTTNLKIVEINFKLSLL